MNRMNNLLDLLARYIVEDEGNAERASRRLMHEGFTPLEVSAALDWHTGPENVRPLETAKGAAWNPAVRCFTVEEERLLSPEAKALVIEETFCRRLDIVKIEEVIDRLRLFEVEEVDREGLKLLLALDNPDPITGAEIKTRVTSLH